MRIIGSCGTSNATKKGTLNFCVRNVQDHIVPVALEVLPVRNLGANIFSVRALAEEGVKCDLLSTPPALRHGNHTFPISTAIPQMYVVNTIIDDVDLDTLDIYHTKVDDHMLNRRMGHRNPRALQQLADKDQSVVRFNRNIDSGDCEVCSAGNSKKSSHPPSDRSHAQTRHEIVHADVWGKHSVASYSGCQSAVMFTDDHSRMRWGVPIKTKDATAEGLHALVQEVADPAGLCIGKVH